MNKKICIAIFITIFVAVIVFFGTRQSEAVPGIVDTPKIFAHRGAVNSFNESTITSYEIAAKNNVDALEIDLRMTKDYVLIVMHDETIDRTTNGVGRVNDLTLKEIKKYETIDEYNGKSTREAIPTLEEVFQRFGDTQKYYIETRLVNGETIMEESLVKLLARYNLLEKNKVAIQSFSEKSLKRITELAPNLRCTLLFKKGNFDLKKALTVDFPVIGLESSDASVRIINTLHKQGKEVHVFFNNEKTMKEEQKEMKALNVDGFFTDNISFTKKLLNR